MIGMSIGVVLNIALALSIDIFAILLIYIITRSASIDIFPKGPFKAVAMSLAVASVCYASYLTYVMISFFVTAAVFLISMVSGAEYAILSKVNKLNLVPMATTLILTLLSYILQESSPTIYLITGISYLVGVWKGIRRHLLPHFEKICVKERVSRSYARAITLNLMIICSLTVLIRWFDIQYLPPLNVFEFGFWTSDLGFATGVSFGFLIMLSRKKALALKLR